MPEILNLQPRRGRQAKPYQVRQVRDVLVKRRLAGPAADTTDAPEGDDEA